MSLSSSPPSQTTAPSREQIYAMSFEPDLLAGHCVLVTGAGDGIGKSAALHYAAHGARVILAGRTTVKLEMVYDAICAAGHPEPAIYPIDFEGASESDYDDMAIAVESKLGGLDGILLNASQLGSIRPVSSYYLQDWDRCMQVNVRSQFMLIKALLPLLERSKKARILFTSSSVGRKGRAHWGAYAVSKFATEGLMQVLADEYDGLSHIGINAINPGRLRTKMRAQAYPAEAPETLNHPDAVMPLYLYAMSSLCNGVSGVSFDAQPIAQA